MNNQTNKTHVTGLDKNTRAYLSGQPAEGRQA